MNRLLLIGVACAILVPAGLALFGGGRPIDAQEDPRTGQKLDELIRTLTETLAQKEAAAGAPAISYEQHVYDVRDMTSPLQHFPAHLRRLVPSGGFGFGFEEEPREPESFLEQDALVELVRGTVAPGSWDELSSVSITATGTGYLVVLHTGAVHERIAALLAELRKSVGTRVTVEMRLLDLPDADLRAALGEGFVLDDAAAAKALSAKTERSASVTATDKQLVGLTDASSVSYVQDYDVEIAKKAAIGDPILQSFSDGLVAQVRPIVSGAGDLVILEVQALAQKAKRPIEVVETPLGAIETPFVSTFDLKTTIAVPAGRWSVAGGALLDGGHGWLLVVRATPSRPAGR